MANEVSAERASALTRDIRTRDGERCKAALHLLKRLPRDEALRMIDMLGLTDTLPENRHSKVSEPTHAEQVTDLIERSNARPRGLCVECGRRIHLLSDGTIGAHKKHWRDKDFGNCYGSGEYPREEYADNKRRALVNHGYFKIQSTR